MIVNIYGASFSAFIIAGQRNAGEKTVRNNLAFV